MQLPAMVDKKLEELAVPLTEGALRIHSVHFTLHAILGNERADEELRKAVQGLFQGLPVALEVVVGVLRGGVCIRVAAALRLHIAHG